MHFVKAQLRSGTRVALQTECNVLFSDLTKANGGNDEGFDPWELLLASINAGLVHGVRAGLSASSGEIREIIVVSQWEEDHTLPIICNISVDGVRISYNPRRIREHLYETTLCKIFPKKAIKIKFVNPKYKK